MSLTSGREEMVADCRYIVRTARAQWYVQKVLFECVNLKYCFAERRMQLSTKSFWVRPLAIAAMHDDMPRL
jgi:hypothetical protein